MTETVTHATFVVERTYEAPPERVFAAWATPEAKAQWFVGPGEWESFDHELDFRVGGEEHASGRVPGGPGFAYDAAYQDIVANERIVSTYRINMTGRLASVSVATVELERVGTATKLVYTEQGAFLDGVDTPAAREHGTVVLLENLAQTLARTTTATT